MRSLNDNRQLNDEPLQETDILISEKYKFFELVRNKFYQLVGLNLLYVLFWLPLVTIFLYFSENNSPVSLKLLLIAAGTLPLGPATAGMLNILYDLMTRKPVFLFSDFMDAVKQNWREGIMLAMLDFIFCILIFIELPFYYNFMSNDAAGTILFIFSILFSFTVVFSNFYLLLMIPVLDIGFITKIKNALLVSMLGTMKNFVILIYCLLVVTPVVLFFPYSVLLLLLFVPVLLGLIILYHTWPLIEKYCVDIELHS